MKEFLEDFRRTVEGASERLLALPEEACAARPAAGGWSPKEIIGHLVDSAANNHQRFVRAQFKDDLVFPGYEQEEWVSSQHYQEAPWPQLVELWRLYNLHLLHVAAHIPADKLRAPRRAHSLHTIAWQAVDAGEPATLEYLVRDYLGHMKSHLGQVLGGDAAAVSTHETARRRRQ